MTKPWVSGYDCGASAALDAGLRKERIIPFGGRMRVMGPIDASTLEALTVLRAHR